MSTGWRPPGAPPRSKKALVSTRKPNSEEGERLKQEGLNRVGERNTDWVDRMKIVKRRLAEKYGEVHADDIRAYAIEHNDLPTNWSAMGLVFTRSSEWYVDGYRKSKYPSRHGNPSGVWKLKGGS